MDRVRHKTRNPSDRVSVSVSKSTYIAYKKEHISNQTTTKSVLLFPPKTAALNRRQRHAGGGAMKAAE